MTTATAFDNLRIVLVETSHPGNIGAVARAMKNMGVGQLVLVNPRRFPDDEAVWRAAHAADLLERARVVTSLEEAVADCGLVVATSARDRTISWPVLDAREACQKLAGEAAAHPVAVVFGREAHGLSNEELHRCNLHLCIPTDEGYSSLNLAMAVQIVCYELRMALQGEGSGDPMAEWDQALATHQDMERLLVHFEQVLTKIGFLDPRAPRQLMTRLRRLLARTRPDWMEVNILRGMLTAMEQAADPPGALPLQDGNPAGDG